MQGIVKHIHQRICCIIWRASNRIFKKLDNFEVLVWPGENSPTTLYAISTLVGMASSSSETIASSLFSDVFRNSPRVTTSVFARLGRIVGSASMKPCRGPVIGGNLALS